MPIQELKEPGANAQPQDPAALDLMRSSHANRGVQPMFSVQTIGSSAVSGSQSMNAIEKTISAGGSRGSRGTGIPLDTLDSWAGTFIGQTLRPSALATNAGPEQRQDHLDEQLDSLVNKQVLGNLVVLPGTHNRLHGGVPCSVVGHSTRTRCAT